jgi:hypothetical protein
VLKKLSSPSAILAFLMVGWASSRLSSLLVSDAYVWQVASVFDTLLLALAVTLAAVLTPYPTLRTKSLAAALATCAWLELIYLALHYSLSFRAYNYWVLFEAVVFVTVAMWYWLRPYATPSDALDRDHLFLLQRLPHTPQGFALSCLGFFGSYGGFALYAGGLIYTYRKGTLVAINSTSVLLQGYHVVKGRRLNDGLLKTLNSGLGQRWTMSSNCLRLRRIWSAGDGVS